MTSKQVDKLIAFGKMALEQGWYDQARDYFEQALALDASNREAMKELARVNEILDRRQAATVEPIKAEPPPRWEIQTVRQKTELPKQRLRVTKRFARLFGTLAVSGSLLFVLLMFFGLLIDTDILVGLAIYCFYDALLFGALWFACWALDKLWEVEG